MRICVLTQYFYPHAGGSQEYIVQLYSHLQKIDPSVAVDVICYNTDNAPKVENYNGLTVYRVGCLQVLPGQFAIPNYLELFQLLRKLKQQHSYDFLNTHTRFFENSWWAPLAAQFLGAQSILTDHCATHPTHQNSFLQTCIQFFDTLLLKSIVHAYKHITVVSTTTQEFLAAYGHTSTVMVAGVDTVFNSKTEKMLPDVKLPENAIVVSYLGRMIPSKNPALVVAAAQKITTAHPDVYFLFAGTGSELSKLQPAATKQIIFLGQLEHKAAAAVLKNTDIFVYPSQHHEGLPISILEAGASGCAVIATDNGGIKEVIIDGETGLFVTPTVADTIEKIEKLLGNAPQRHKLAAALQKKVAQTFSWQQTAQKFSDYLQSLKQS
jgi:glycosyltransferase involved in cell wall biosynthesis